MKPGDIFAIFSSTGMLSGIWGINKGRQYNARYESLPTIWKDHKRGFVLANSFWEGKEEFVRINKEPFKIGVIYNDEPEFAVVTYQANEIVKPWHHRMPLILTDQGVHEFLSGKPAILLPDNEIIGLTQIAA